MDRAFSKWIVYVAIALVAVYCWKNYYWLSNAARVYVDNWWR